MNKNLLWFSTYLKILKYKRGNLSRSKNLSDIWQQDENQIIKFHKSIPIWDSRRWIFLPTIFINNACAYQMSMNI